MEGQLKDTTLDPSLLPSINAILNGLAGVLLVVGVVFIKSKNVVAHKRCMLAAFVVSTIFLVSYVIDKSIKRGAHTPFNGEGLIKIAYYMMLISHVILAMVVPVLAIWLMKLAFAQKFETHRRVARFAFPVWMYVSITGVLIYLVLYQFNPS